MTQEELAESLCVSLGKQLRACVESARADERAAKCATWEAAADWWRSANPSDRRTFLGLIGGDRHQTANAYTVYPGE